MIKVAMRTNLLIMAIAAALIIDGCGGGGGSPGRGGELTPPILRLSAPTSASSISDGEFNDQSFAIRFKYYDESAMAFNAFSATMQLDGGAAQDITSYFSQKDSDTIESANLYQFTSGLFDVRTNNVPHTITVSASIKDAQTNQGATTGQFTVTVGGVDDLIGIMDDLKNY